MSHLETRFNGTSFQVTITWLIPWHHVQEFRRLNPGLTKSGTIAFGSPLLPTFTRSSYGCLDVMLLEIGSANSLLASMR